ncbi:unnamed protein product [Vitrella brassicaformis CCMP3155]|uniref:Uncharacterized protein n=1 Tax=Vitrella brassicaformis (strain CCMP3155) TaxID=1169540 RepID=A0A0G4EQ98_VITBC|nr:unnamed protein product [Vitrella brassicaformis CCMP3155]|mmetsp:Transcript_35161/g.87312  ORF Transcript_35161/g.87312 Transcript_35161/m.87312 type:complete len:98 (+) Transcript_35161:91-384(+)|eukprot:CEL99594.1 unnamed protein product [Vitrella brassicaformis CCMP3155]
MRPFLRLKEEAGDEIVAFFRVGRSFYVFVMGVVLIILSIILMAATFESKEAKAAAPGWERFVAATGSNQWVSSSLFLSCGCVVMAINYLPRLAGEAA